MIRRLQAGLLAAVALLVASDARAQYFGANKVRYESFDFRVASTEHFDIYYYPEEETTIAEAARMAERWHARLVELLRHELSTRQPLILYAAHPHFEQTNAIPGFLGESTGGVTEALKRRVVMPLAGTLQGTDHVLGHELVHAFQYDMSGPLGGRAAGLPLWFIEGMAEYLSVGPIDPVTAMWLRDAVAREALPDIRDLDDPRLFPYRYGHALWSYLAGRWGGTAVGDILRAALDSGSAATGIEETTGLDIETVSREWHEALVSAYRPILAVTSDADRPPILGAENAGEVNVGPALSPDGRSLVFLSEKDRLSIDLYLADARTGRIVRKLLKTATDPHLDSLQFINSAGAWSRAGDRLALAVISKGQPRLLVLDVERNRTVREIELAELGEIFSPTWAPEGGAIAFTAVAGGATDLYVYDLERDALRRLTDDVYSDLQPAWSPDGRNLAFVSDRFSTELKTLDFGRYELAVIDVASGDIRRVGAFREGQHINPQWSPDGEALYFVSDRTGISNLYRLELSGGRIRQLTNVTTGVAGITSLSPAISVASRSGDVAYSVFRDGGYAIHFQANPEDVAAPLQDAPEYRRAALLPPAERSDGLSALLARSSEGLPARPIRETADYRPSLALDYVGQPYLVAGADPFGTFVGGGISFLFSDMLGDHTLGTQIQVNGAFQDIAGQVGYVNRSSRWLWGGVAEQVPFVSGFVVSGVAAVDGEPALVQRIDRFRQIDRQVAGLVAYPFSRAARVEFTAGGRFIDFSREIESTVASLATGRILFQEERELPAPEGLILAQSSAALVYDTSRMGLTGPLVGRRARFEISPTFGSLAFSELLADFRQYWMPVTPWTIAGRLLHFGRYGGDAEDPRLSPLFLGYPNLVRGYAFDSFSPDECTRTAAGGCPEVDRLIGSRLAVANLEVRAPLVGAFTGDLSYGGLPIELLAFADGGVAWTRADSLLPSGEERAVWSAGAGLRAALGFVIMEFDAVRPFSRPRKDWVFQFSFRPGL